MSDITLTQVDDDLIRAINARAAATGRSSEQVAREALRYGLLVDRAGLKDVARHIRALSPGQVEEDSTAIVRRLRKGGS